MKSRRSPGAAFARFIMRSCMSLEKNFTMLLSRPCSATFIHANPFDPYAATNAVRSSMSVLVKDAHPLALMHLTMPPALAMSANTLNPESLTMSFISTRWRPKRVSGLSLPYASMAS